MDAKDRWRNILKKREQLREHMAALQQAQAEAEQAQAEAEQQAAEEERRDALLSVAETELQSVSQGALQCSKFIVQAHTTTMAGTCQQPCTSLQV